MKEVYITLTPNERSNYREIISHVSEEVWPEFMFHDPVADEHWDGLFEDFAEFQFALLDQGSGEIAGIGNSVPLHWEGEPDNLPDDGWDWALKKSASDHSRGIAPNILCGIQISIAPAFQGRHLSKELLKGMKKLARSKNLSPLIIPVRPNRKDQYPLTPIDRYIEWKDEQGLPFDPWLRVHARNGGQIIKACHTAMRIYGAISEWEAWTGLDFPESGDYIIPGALVPVVMDRDADLGVYTEPNVWVIHRVDER